MDVSLVEFIVYAIICYTGLIGLIFSAFKHGEAVQKDSLRNIWLLPSIICAYVLSNMNGSIFLDTGTTTSINTNLNTTETWSETITHASTFTLVDPIWVAVHSMIMIIMIVYVVVNIITLLANIKKN